MSYAQIYNDEAAKCLILGHDKEAEAYARAALQVEDHNAGAWSNLGVALYHRGLFSEAIQCFDNALTLQPNATHALINMGMMMRETGDLDRALKYAQLAERTGHPLGEHLLAEIYLHRHEFADGWRHLESRFCTTPPITKMREFDIPMFSSEDVGKGLKVIVWPEQGIGDQILYATLLDDFCERCDVSIYFDSPRIGHWYPQFGAKAPYDRHIPLGSVAQYVREDAKDFERQQVRTICIPRVLIKTSERTVVGISWKSTQPKARSWLGDKKSATLPDLAALMGLDNAHLVSVQYDVTDDEARQWSKWVQFPAFDLRNELDKTAALIDACDFILTTCSVTAHIAGALGKPTYLMHQGEPLYHYWRTDKHGGSLWYPSVRSLARPGATWKSMVEEFVGMLP